MNNLLKNIGIWLVIGLVVLTVVKQFDARQATKDTLPYSEFMAQAKDGKVESAVIEGPLPDRRPRPRPRPPRSRRDPPSRDS